jgi:hypothetical protein
MAHCSRQRQRAFQLPKKSLWGNVYSLAISASLHFTIPEELLGAFGDRFAESPLTLVIALVIFVVCKDDVYIYGQISVQDEHFVFKVG